jgi:hypothetical protein
MRDRRSSVLLLIGSRNDGVYHPPGALVTASGFAPAQLEPCTPCGGVLVLDDFGRAIRRRKGRGVMLDRFKRRTPCTSCGGHLDEHGAIVKGAGYVARDPMDALGLRVGSTSTRATESRPRRTVTCDACNGEGVGGAHLDDDGLEYRDQCARCEGTGRRELHAFELALDVRDVEERDPLSTAVDARTESGSYLELDRALDALRRSDRVGHRDLLAAVDAHRFPLVAACEVALAFVVARMPEHVKVPAQVVANARELAKHRTRAKGRSSDRRALEQRDKEIRRLHRDGKPVPWIAQEYGLSVSTIYAVLKRRRELSAA